MADTAAKIQADDPTPWALDLCCGAGRAMIQAAEHLRHAGLLDRVSLVGVDTVELAWRGASPK